MNHCQLPPPETIERQFRLLAFVFLVIALAQATEAFTSVVTQEKLLSYLQMADSFFSFFVLIPIAYFSVWKAKTYYRVPKHLRKYIKENESFAYEVWKRSIINSWVAVLFCLFAIRPLSKLSQAHTIGFFSRIILAIMLAVFSLSFFYLYRTDDFEDAEQDNRL